jgi:ankyrin repeat protein
VPRWSKLGVLFPLILVAASPDLALFDAVIDGRRVRVERLLERGADPNATRAFEADSALAVAAEHGRDEICEVLINAGANVNGISGAARDTPLHRGACAGERAVVRVLLAHGAIPDVRDASGTTPIGCAGPTTRDLLERALTASGLDVVRDGASALDPSFGPEVSPQDAALRRESQLPALIEAAWANDAGEIQVLLRENSPEPRTLEGAHVGGRRIAAESTAAHVATSWGRFNALGLLVEGGVDVEAVDVWGRTPLHVAAWRGRPSIARGLLSARADPARSDKQGYTALDYAAWRGDVPLTEAMASQVTPEVRAQAARTAAWRGRREVFRALWRPGSGDTALIEAAVVGDHWEIVLDVVSQGEPELGGLLALCLEWDAAGSAAILIRNGAAEVPSPHPLSAEMRAALAGRMSGVTGGDDGPDQQLETAVALRGAGKRDEAFRILVGLEANTPWLGRVQRALGDHAWTEGDPETAVEHYRRALQIDPRDAAAERWLQRRVVEAPAREPDP